MDLPADGKDLDMSRGHISHEIWEHTEMDPDEEDIGDWDEESPPEAQLRNQAYEAIRTRDVEGLRQLLREGLTADDLGPEAARAAVTTGQLGLVPFLLGLTNELVTSDLSAYLTDPRLSPEFIRAFIRGGVKLPYALDHYVRGPIDDLIKKYPQLFAILFEEGYLFHLYGNSISLLKPTAKYYPHLVPLMLQRYAKLPADTRDHSIFNTTAGAMRALQQQPKPLTVTQLRALDALIQFGIRHPLARVREVVGAEVEQLWKSDVAPWLKYRYGRNPGLQTRTTAALSALLPGALVRYLHRAI